MGLTIGVDIGGTKIAAGVVDEEGRILSTFKVSTPPTAEGIVDAISSAVSGASEGHDVEAVGIGAAGYVDDKRATVLFAPNINWRHEPLKDKVEQRVGLPVVVENDANAAAWGEYRFGAGQGHDDVICITLGTGLGDGSVEGIEGKHISQAARQGCPVAVDSFRELARWAGAGLADLASLFDPSAFIVGGGVSDEGELVLDPIRKSFRRWLIGGEWRPHAQVLAAQLGGKAGLVGAADLARQG